MSKLFLSPPAKLTKLHYLTSCCLLLRFREFYNTLNDAISLSKTIEFWLRLIMLNSNRQSMMILLDFRQNNLYSKRWLFAVFGTEINTHCALEVSWLALAVLR